MLPGYLFAGLPYAAILALVVLLWSIRKKIKRIRLSKSTGLDIEFFGSVRKRKQFHLSTRSKVIETEKEGESQLTLNLINTYVYILQVDCRQLIY